MEISHISSLPTDDAGAACVAAIPVFYSEYMIADAQSYSPSATKPRAVLAAWKAEKLPIAIRPFRSASAQDLALTHDPAYVRGILSGTLANGFGNHSAEVARSLPWTTGAMRSAARYALTHGIACAPVSGFHHAHYDSAGGYCTFNGLTVTVARLLHEGLVRRVLILDCDYHYGDGTDQIIERLSLQGAITNASFGRSFHEPSQAGAYLDELRRTVATFPAYDLVLYQAGADVHVDDPLGGLLTTAQMRERDRIVFEAARAKSVPLAWNLAGGYQEPLSKVVELHVNTMRECAAVYSAKTASVSP